MDILIHRNLSCRVKPKRILLGKKLRVMDNVVLELNRISEVTIGDNCTLSYGVVIALTGIFKMGNDVMVGEYSSIRDFTHDHTIPDIPMTKTREFIGNITIGNNIWIGRGSIILPGTTIPDGVVIGANSVVKGSLEPNGIYAGAPAKLIRYRDPDRATTS